MLAARDLYGFVMQLEGFFTSEGGSEAFGDHVVIGLAALDDLSAEWDRLVEAVLDRAPRAESIARLQDWADRHPITDVPFMRETIVGEAAQLVGVGAGGLGALVGSLQETLARLETRIGFLNETAVKQAQWTMELAAVELMDSDEAGALQQFLLSTGKLSDSGAAVAPSPVVHVAHESATRSIAAHADQASPRAPVRENNIYSDRNGNVYRQNR